MVENIYLNDTTNLGASGRRSNVEESSKCVEAKWSKILAIVLFVTSTIMFISGIVCLVVSLNLEGGNSAENSNTRLSNQIENYTASPEVRKCECPTNGATTISSITVTTQANRTINGASFETITVMTDLKIPASISLPYGQVAGHAYVFTGNVTVKSGYQRFSINFFTTTTDFSAILYHFNPRFEELRIVRAAKVKCDAWKSVSNIHYSDKPYPFSPGNVFTLTVIVEENKFATIINGENVLDYQPEEVNIADVDQLNIGIEGSVEVQSVETLHRI